MSTKMVIVMRKDLNMRKGKMCAQASHASMKVFFDKIHHYTEDGCVIMNLSPDMISWMQGIFTKIVVGCDTERDLFDVIAAARDANLPAALITDCGATEFNGVPTHTCVAVGPAEAEVIDKITGGFKLL